MKCWLGLSSSATVVLEKVIWPNHFHDFFHSRDPPRPTFLDARRIQQKRPKDEIKNEIERKRKDDSWIVEGVFGELAELFLPQAQSLIFLDMDWTICRAGLLARGSESSKQLKAVKAEENFKNLLLWAEQYWTRTNLCSRSGHLRLFSNFAGLKFRFTSRAEVDGFIKQQKAD